MNRLYQWFVLIDSCDRSFELIVVGETIDIPEEMFSILWNTISLSGGGSSDISLDD